MNLYNSHGTRCENIGDNKDVWVVKQLRRISRLEQVGESEIEIWLWKNASPSLKNFMIEKCEEEEVKSWETLEAKLESFIKAWKERKEHSRKDEEGEKLKKAITKKKEGSSRNEEKRLKEQLAKPGKEVWNMKRARIMRRTVERKCYNCGESGHLARDCTENKLDSNYMSFGLNCENKIKIERVDENISEEKEENKRSKIIDGYKKTGNKTEDAIKNELRRHYPSVISQEGRKVRYCKLENYKINTSEDKIISRKNRTYQTLLKDAKEYVKDLENRGIIRKSESK